MQNFIRNTQKQWVQDFLAEQIPIVLVDLRPFKVTGKAAEVIAGNSNITCIKNGIPFDTEKMIITSGLDLDHNSNKRIWIKWI